jgi:hypothetical protein
MTNPTTEVSSDNMLMDLRLVILRAISAVWNDDHNKSRAANSDTIADKLDAISLRKYLTHCSNSQLQEYLKTTFNYRIPLYNFGISFIPATANWNLHGNQEWSKPHDETITLCLPSCEVDWNEYEKTERLMEYYSYFPNLFGSAKSQQFGSSSSLKSSKSEGNAPLYLAENKNTQPHDRPSLQQTLNKGQTGIDLRGNDYNLGVSEDSFLSFGAVVNKLIAVAWSNPHFRSIIDYDCKEESTSDETYYNNLFKTLKQHYNFVIPWAFNIKLVFSHCFEQSGDVVHEDSNVSRLSFWIKNTHAEKNTEWIWRWSNDEANLPLDSGLIRNSVSLEIPNTPMSTQDNISLALAKYNAIGPAYPFTCS